MSEQDNEPLGVDVSILELPEAPGHWLVEAVDYGSEGEVYRAEFESHKAEQCAHRYVEMMWPGRFAITPQPPKPSSPRPRAKLFMVPTTLPKGARE